MRTVHHSSRGRTASVRGALVALGLALALLVAGCAPLTGDGTEPASGDAASVEPGASTEGTATAPSPEPTTSSPSAVPGESSTTTPQDAEDAEREAEAEAERKAEAEQEAKDKAEQKAAEKDAEREKKEREAAEQEAEEKAEEKAAKEAQEKRDRMLEYGDTGDRVVALQEQLADLGYFLTDADGSFGPATQQAVWALQKAAGLYRDGVVGEQTQAAIDAGTRPSAQSSSGKAVEIDLDKQLLMTVEDGKVTRIVNASSGNGDTYEAKGRTYHASTPRGSFAVYMERNGMHESTLELGSMYRPKYFSGGYAVHGSGSIPPYPASHGCVRVSNAAMNWLWDSWDLAKGTPVILY